MVRPVFHTIRGRGSPEQSIGGVGRCIYCGESPPAGELIDDRLLSEGLGGGLVLRRSICRACACAADAFAPESRLWGGGDLESEAGFPLPLFVTDELPGVMLEKPPEVRADVRPHVPSADTVGFGRTAQMVAKIAHAMAFAVFRDQFVPFLPRYLMAKDPEVLTFLIGSRPEGRRDALHWMSVEDLERGPEGNSAFPKRIVSVRLQLFADRGAPTFTVVAGTVRKPGPLEVFWRPGRPFNERRFPLRGGPLIASACR